MKSNIAIMHLSDFHINISSEIVLNQRIEQVTGALNVFDSELANCQSLVLVASGDIANKGNHEEYGIAK